MWPGFKKVKHFVDNKAKGRISNRVFQENTARQIFRITKISCPLIRTPPRDNQTHSSHSSAVRFLENFGVLCFLETPVLRFTLLPYYRRSVIFQKSTLKLSVSFYFTLIAVMVILFTKYTMFRFSSRYTCVKQIWASKINIVFCLIWIFVTFLSYNFIIKTIRYPSLCCLHFCWRNVSTYWWIDFDYDDQFILFMTCLTDERRLALFTAGSIASDPHHCQYPTRRIWTCAEPEFSLC